MKGVETWTHLETNWNHDKIQGDAEFEHSWMTCDGGSCWRMKVAAGKQNHQSVQTSLSKTSLFFDLRGGRSAATGHLEAGRPITVHHKVSRSDRNIRRLPGDRQRSSLSLFEGG